LKIFERRRNAAENLSGIDRRRQQREPRALVARRVRKDRPRLNNREVLRPHAPIRTRKAGLEHTQPILRDVIGGVHGKDGVGDWIEIAAHRFQPFVAARFRDHEHDTLDRMRGRAVDLSDFVRKIGKLQVEIQKFAKRRGAAPKHRAGGEFKH